VDLSQEHYGRGKSRKKEKKMKMRRREMARGEPFLIYGLLHNP
jgi:hypothetical protein